jgi:isocitrate dehydrogenase (NAD+)
LIPGDGIGPEVSKAVQDILEASGVAIEWEEASARGTMDRRAMDIMQSPAVKSILKNRVALKGPLETAVATGPPSLNVQLRKALDLYANVRPVKNLAGVTSRFQNVDIVLIRENTEDLYAGLEHEVVPGVVESLKIITEKASTRIARFAFEYARKWERKRIHSIHKANIMKRSDGLFLASIRNVAKEYPDIEYK